MNCLSHLHYSKEVLNDKLKLGKAEHDEADEGGEATMHDGHEDLVNCHRHTLISCAWRLHEGEEDVSSELDTYKADMIAVVCT